MYMDCKSAVTRHEWNHELNAMHKQVVDDARKRIRCSFPHPSKRYVLRDL
jgi:hypothetical protein